VIVLKIFFKKGQLVKDALFSREGETFPASLNGMNLGLRLVSFRRPATGTWQSAAIRNAKKHHLWNCAGSCGLTAVIGG